MAGLARQPRCVHIHCTLYLEPHLGPPGYSSFIVRTSKALRLPRRRLVVDALFASDMSCFNLLHPPGVIHHDLSISSSLSTRFGWKGLESGLGRSQISLLHLLLKSFKLFTTPITSSFLLLLPCSTPQLTCQASQKFSGSPSFNGEVQPQRFNATKALGQLTRKSSRRAERG